MPESAPVSHIRTARPQQVIKQSSNYPKHILPTGRASHAIRQSLLELSNETSHSSRHFVRIESYKIGAVISSPLESYRIEGHLSQRICKVIWSHPVLPVQQLSWKMLGRA